VGGVLGIALLLMVSLLTLWGGRDWTAWGLFAFSLGHLLNNGLFEITSAPIPNFWIQQIRQVLQLLASGPALYLMAESLALPWLRPLPRRAVRFAVAVLTVTAIIATIVPELSLIYRGSRPPALVYTARDASTTIMLAVPVLALIFGHAGVPHENRLRIRWILLSTLLLLLTTTVLGVLSEASHPYLYQMINTAVFGLAIFGYLYAILRTRVVDVAFVIDRTLAFSATTGILFGMFSLLEQMLDRLVVAEKLSSTLKAAGAFLVALAIRPLHHWSDRSLERLFFHRQRAIVAAFKAFCMESAFFETQEALLLQACSYLMRVCAAVAIYERYGSSYKSRAGQGHNWPSCIGVDDPMIVALRTHRRELQVKNLGSAIGTDFLAFPMMLGNTLTGVVICRPRDGEQLDSSVRMALSELARCLATSVYLLRYEEQTRLMADIASGHLDAMAVRSRAMVLLGNALTPFAVPTAAKE